jgi:hypothetical integral membrane protein (TIGR02206 family)
MAEFQPYSLVHLAILLLMAAATAGAIALRGRLNERRQRKLDLLVAALNGLWWLTASTLPLFSGTWSWSLHLPLQACDIAALVAVGAFWPNWRFCRAMLYFVGIGLSSWALWTPDLRQGPAKLAFWIFFLGHGATVGAAFFDVLARRFRPTWRDWRNVVLAMFIWIFVAFALNAYFGWNYGYVGNSLAGSTNPIHFLGPWPWRVAVLAMCVIGFLALMTWPWNARRERN